MPLESPQSVEAAITSEVRRVASLLRRKIVASGLSQRQIERRLGWGEGYLSQLLTAKVDLKLKHFFELAETLELPSSVLLAELYGLPDDAEPRTDRRELRELVGEWVREILAEGGAQSRPRRSFGTGQP